MTPYFEHGRIQIYLGSVLKVLGEIPSESIQCVVTSPPYWGLRDYGTGEWEGGDDPSCTHKPSEEETQARNVISSNLQGGKNTQINSLHISDGPVYKCKKCGAKRIDEQIGLEPTPNEYIAKLVEVFRDVRRVLRKDGTCWVNMGDTYSANRGYQIPDNKHCDVGNSKGMKAEDIGLKPKNLIGIPWRLAFALQEDGWYLRQDIIWSKPNPMPESVTDRCTKSHEYIFLLTKSAHYYYDADAIKEKSTGQTGLAISFERETKECLVPGQANTQHRINRSSTTPKIHGNIPGRSDGGAACNKPGQDYRNKRSVWEITPESFREAHFATYPTELVKPCILAGTSEKGCCSECGAPFFRVLDSERIMRHELPKDNPNYRPARYTVKSSGADDYAKGGGQAFRRSETIGWEPTCTCFTEPLDEDNPAVVPCTVLDPFSGSGTTGEVARDNGCKYIGIELNPEYIDISAKRLAQDVLSFA